MVICDKCHIPLSDDQPCYDTGLYEAQTGKTVEGCHAGLWLCRECVKAFKTSLFTLVNSYKVRFRLADKQEGK